MIRAKHVLFLIFIPSFLTQENDYETISKYGNPMLQRTLAYFDQDVFLPQIYNHGCWCGILQPQNDGDTPYIRRGKPLDSLDHICRDWSFCKNCVLKETACESQTLYTYIITQPETNNDLFSCERPQVSACAKERCLCDTIAARQISEYLSSHDFQTVNAWAPENNQKCQSGSPTEKKDRCCKTQGLTANYWISYNSEKYTCTEEGKMVSGVVRTINVPSTQAPPNPKKRRKQANGGKKKKGKKSAKVVTVTKPITTARPTTTSIPPTTTTTAKTTTIKPTTEEAKLVVEEGNGNDYYYYEYVGAAHTRTTEQQSEEANEENEEDDYMPIFDQYDYTTASPQDEETTAADFNNGGGEGFDDQGEWWWYE